MNVWKERLKLMKIITDIPDQTYDRIKTGFPDEKDRECAIAAIKAGKPLTDAIHEIESNISAQNGTYLNQGLSKAISILDPKYYPDIFMGVKK